MNAFEESAEALGKVKELVLNGHSIHENFESQLSVFQVKLVKLEERITQFEERHEKVATAYESLVETIKDDHQGVINEQKLVFKESISKLKSDQADAIATYRQLIGELNQQQQAFRSDITNLRSDVIQLSRESVEALKNIKDSMQTFDNSFSKHRTEMHEQFLAIDNKIGTVALRLNEIDEKNIEGRGQLSSRQKSLNQQLEATKKSAKLWRIFASGLLLGLLMNVIIEKWFLGG